MADIANSIDPHIQVTVDSPEANGDARMPVLDLKIWLKWMDDKPIVTYTFYKKLCASEYTILKEVSGQKGCEEEHYLSGGPQEDTTHLLQPSLAGNS